ncbi:pirin family protein [Streptomyces hirsutus]
MAGRGAVGTDRRPVHVGQTAVFGAGGSLTVRADEKQDSNTPDLEVVLLGGQPIREPMAHYGPFVMNDPRGSSEQAFEDFQKGRLGSVPAVHGMSASGPQES